MVISCKHDAEGYIIGQAHDNPILDSSIYDVEFADEEVTTLMANAVTKALYAPCDPDGNEFFLLNELIDATSNEDALTLDQQIITVNGVTC